MKIDPKFHGRRNNQAIKNPMESKAFKFKKIETEPIQDEIKILKSRKYLGKYPIQEGKNEILWISPNKKKRVRKLLLM
jgi:hypothetical protein